MCASAARPVEDGRGHDARGAINMGFVMDPNKCASNGNGTCEKARSETEKDDYDPFSEREVSRQYSNLGAFFHLLKGGLGSGIMAMPMAFSHSGLILGVVGTIVTGIVCTHCMVILVRSAQTLYFRLRIPTLGMGETAEAAFANGPKRLRPLATFARNFVKLSLFFCYAMSMSAYIVAIGSSVQQMVEQHSHKDILDQRIYIVALMVPLIPMCQLRLLKHLVPCSFIANSCIVAGLGITVYYIFHELPDPESRRFGVKDIQGMPIFFSTALFAMEGIGSVMPIENTMKNPRKMTGWTGVMTLAMTCIVALFACVGFLGYLKFGDNTLGNIALSLPTEEIPAQVVKVLIGVAILFTVPVQYFVCAEILWSYISPYVTPARHRLGEGVTRAVLIICCMVLAVAIPDLDLIISLVGAIFFSALGIFVPAAIELVVDWETSDRATRFGLAGKNGALIAVSVFTAVSGVYAALYEAVYKPEAQPSP
ncbi:Proton coupled amino acid transporter [Frankliniella occidentalis]|uniref:Proton-coupled amino acid transporter-like protein pathetic isoform X2 n=1 Tax=Frankliniella occidentalis TaxID=133901 RepID=A0A6J1S020_FRAOC|nr:proton-coupled amino acid transporter-like protein pathetic isoform X2 [Frankliniella occidentalis]KAE8741966.1 Proton coupled amino acid transporter [Frankliniella occidentalis]